MIHINLDVLVIKYHICSAVSSAKNFSDPVQPHSSASMQADYHQSTILLGIEVPWVHLPESCGCSES